MVARPQVEMFRCLVEHSARWEELSVEMTPDIFPLLVPLADRFQPLCRAWIQWDGPASQAGVESIDCFRSAPRLVQFGTYNEHHSRLYVSYMEILDHIRAPSLTGMAFYHEADDENRLFHLELFVSRSGCILRRLAIKGSPDAHTTVEVLQKYPSMTELAIIMVDDDLEAHNTLISQLTIPNPTGDAPVSAII
ncbi:hypothetical protein FB451DRAFT_1176250 [Mycena latifolia]|nr:hypothetical protein FB451DRAFT_1176250 [Mycena latifolia]